MAEEQRIYAYYNMDKAMVSKMLASFDKSITVDIITSIHNGMSTSNYCITAGYRKYLLKVYSGYIGIETAVYEYLQNQIRIPQLYYYDDIRENCPYPYAIIEYISGETLLEYIKRNRSYSTEIVYEIGRMLSLIHKKRYPERGWLDRELCISKPSKGTRESILSALEGKPGARISASVHDRLTEYMNKNPDIFSRIDRESVLCHGDIGYNNILISKDVVYFIDFEYAMAESRYRDIGRFFRKKDPNIQQYLSASVYNAFAEGYSGLSSDWLQLAKVADIPAMLGLLNIDAAPQDWVDDIEHDIIEATR